MQKFSGTLTRKLTISQVVKLRHRMNFAVINRTHLEHAATALAIQIVLSFITGNVWVGAAFASAFFLGREHAQREYKLGDPSKLMGHEAFDIWRWKLDAQLDLLFPVIVTVVVAVATHYLV